MRLVAYLTNTVAVSNPVNTVTVANPVSTVTVANPVSTVTVANPVNTVTVANPTANPETGLAKDATVSRRFGTGVTLSDGGLLTTTTTYTPTVGKMMRLKWIIAVPNSDNSGANYLDVRWQGAAKPLYCGFALAHWEAFTAPAVNTPLVITLANSQPVAVTIHYEEI